MSKVQYIEKTEQKHVFSRDMNIAIDFTINTI